MLDKLIICLVFQLGLLSVFCKEPLDSSSDFQHLSNCTLPDHPQNGSYKVLEAVVATHPGAVVPVNTIIHYNCDVTFEPLIFSTAICIDGNWETQFIKCQKKVTCPLPVTPANGTYELSGQDYPLRQSAEVSSWSIVTYSCKSSFEIVGSRTALCWNGFWSGEAPECHKTNACVLPGLQVNGNYSIIGALDAPIAGSTVEEHQKLLYDCPAPNILKGGSIIECVEGNWKPEVPSCLGNRPCTLPSVPSNGYINVVADVDEFLPGIQVGSLSSVEYSCDAFYELTGAGNITCDNGIWSSEPPECRRSTYCILPDLPKRGNYSIVGSNEPPVPGAPIAEKEDLLYNCITKTEVIVCSNGEWVPGVVECLDYPSDCGDVLGNTSGLYVIQPTTNSQLLEVYCDLTLTKQKWTVIQQRLDGDVDFYRNSTEYSEGFGNKAGNHWLGLEHIHEITKAENHELYIELETYNGTKAYARYNTFIVGSSCTGFQLTIRGYSGTAGNSMYDTDDTRAELNGMKFSTFDKDQDEWSDGNCAEVFHGAWWYSGCGYSNLNGQYFETPLRNTSSMYWARMTNGHAFTLKTARMLVRRKHA